MSGRTALLAAGGTGGHLFPAQALAVELASRGWTVDLATDERADRYGFAFPAREVHIIPADTIRSRSPVALARTALSLGRGLVRATGVMRRVRPDVVVGFGGYPTLPPLLSATMLKIPTALHEANAVMGRANKILAHVTRAVATSWPETRFVEGALAAKAVVTGIPVRPAVLAAANTPFSPPNDRFRLLVFGGSQGARVFSDILPQVLAELDPALRQRIDLVQQVRPEDISRVRNAYDGLGLRAELESFFKDMPERIARAHLVIARSGASTVAELAVIGRPGLLVPLPHALDADQLANARALVNAGGAIVEEQKTLTPQILAGHLRDLFSAPERLAAMAAAARALGRPDAVTRLADLVERLASGNQPR